MGADAEAYYTPYYESSSPNSNAIFVSKFKNGLQTAYNNPQFKKQPFNDFNQQSAYDQREYNKKPFNNFNQQSAYDQREYNQQPFNNFNQQSAYNPKKYSQQPFNKSNQQSVNKPMENNLDQEQIKGLVTKVFNMFKNLKVGAN